MPLDLSLIDAPTPPEAFHVQTMVDRLATRLAREKGGSVPSGFEGQPPPPRRGLNPLLVYGPPVAGGADAYTTLRNIDRGASEADPLMRPFVGSPGALYGVEVGGGLVLGQLANLLAKKGHRTAGKVLGGVALVLPAAGAVINLKRGAEHGGAR